jgi:hypothetical protein
MLAMLAYLHKASESLDLREMGPKDCQVQTCGEFGRLMLYCG